MNMMSDPNREDDTLGGRLARARDAAGMSEADIARQIGVKKTTIVAWETDRAAPRANRLTMLAGILGVSASWLLYGVGNSPITETVSDEIRVLRGQLDRLRELRQQTADIIDAMDSAIDRIQSQQE